MSLHYDVNLVTDLLNPGLAGWSIGPSPIPPGWAPLGVAGRAELRRRESSAQRVESGEPRLRIGLGGAVRLRCNAQAVFPCT